MTKLRAFLIHLGISLFVFGVIAYLVAEVWYPGFFFQTDGGWQGLRLLLGVDLVVGPLLTLIVYRAGKPGLKVDLALIGAMQVACLAAGVWIVRGERPLAIVYVDGSFFSVTAQSFKEVNMPVPNLDSLPGPYPKWVSVKLPKAYDAQSTIRREMLVSGRMLATRWEDYAPFDPKDLEEKEARQAREIVDRDRDSQAIPPWLAEHGHGIENYRFYLFGARYAYCYLGFDANGERFVDILPVRARG
jgi:hypothetical protein